VGRNRKFKKAVGALTELTMMLSSRLRPVYMKQLIILFLFFMLSTLAAVGEDLAHEKETGRFWIHGRLSAWNGTPTFRIWVVGTKRILGVTQNPESANSDFPEMPQDLVDVFFAQDSVFGTNIYGDFLVEPLIPDKKGAMRPVRIIAFKKLVVTYGDKLVDAGITLPVVTQSLH
jgi:hypothetical protein